MKFNKVHPLINESQQVFCQKKFTKLLLDLGLKNDNRSVGSGLGGNNFQLVVLMNCEHHLVLGEQFAVSEKIFEWGVDFFYQDLKKIRAALDFVVQFLDEKFKLHALIFESVVGHWNIFEALKSNAQHFPRLANHINGHSMDFDLFLSPLDHLIQAYSMCQVLMGDLQLRGMNSPMVSQVGKFLNQCESEIILLSVRRFISLPNIIQFKLDLHPDCKPFFDRVNKEI